MGLSIKTNNQRAAEDLSQTSIQVSNNISPRKRRIIIKGDHSARRPPTSGNQNKKNTEIME